MEDTIKQGNFVPNSHTSVVVGPSNWHWGERRNEITNNLAENLMDTLILFLHDVQILARKIIHTTKGDTRVTVLRTVSGPSSLSSLE